MKKQVKVLIIEDSEDDATLAIRVLQRGGFEPTYRRVQTAVELHAALAGEHWDVVISDFNLPGFTGMDALRIFRATGLDIPFILISGTVGEEVAVDAMKAGANDYIVKLNLPRLASVLERELHEAANRAAHRQADAKQREVTQLLDNIVENIPTAVQLKSVRDDFRILMWNKAAEAMYGLPRDAAIGRRVQDLWPESDAARMHAADLELVSTKSSQDFPDRLAQTIDRGDIRVHMRKVALCDAGGNPTHLLVIADDMTAQLAHQTRLAESEARFRSLTELSSDWFWEQDAEHRFVRFSGGEGVVGWGPDQLKAIGVRRWELPSIVSLDGDWSAHKAELDAHKPFKNFEYRRFLEDGSLQYVAASGEPIFDTGGRFTGYRGVATDITGRKRGEEALIRFSTAMDATADAIYLVDRTSMEFVHVNEAACRMQSLTRAELLSLGPEGVLGTPRAELERIYDAIIASEANAEPLEMLRSRNDGSQVWVELRRHAQRSGDHWTIVTLVRDITERKEADAKIVRLNRVYAVLSGINSAIVRIRERDALFSEVCRLAVSEGGFFVARVVELDPNGKARLVASTETDALLFQQIVNEYNSDPAHSQSLLALGLRSRQPLISNDVANDPRIPRRAELTTGGTYAVALLPIIVEQRIAGVVVLRAQEAGMFDEAELRLLLEVVANLSFALANIEKEKKVRRLTRIYALVSGINALIVRASSRDELFREVCQIAVEQGRFKMAWIGVVDRNGMKIEPIASAGTEPEFLTLIKDRWSLRVDSPMGNTRSARAVREKKAIVANEIGGAGDTSIFFAKERIERGIQSMAVLPLLVSDEAVGVLALYADEIGFFDDEELKLLTGLTGDIAFALEHIEKAEKLARMTRMNAMLSGINGAIVRIRDRQKLFEEACRIAVETGGLPFAWMGVVDVSGTQLQLLASAGRDDGFMQAIRDRLAIRDEAPEAQGLSARAIREGRVVVVNDVAADAVLSRRQAFANRGIKSVAVFPLIIASRVSGAFALHSEHAGFFDDDELKLLNEVAGNIAFALEHIEQEEKVRRLTRVHAVLGGINALIVHACDRDELFKESCRIAVDQGLFRMAWIGVVDRAKMELIPVAAAGTTEDSLTLVNQRFSLLEDEPTGNTLSARAIREKRAIVSNDVQNDARIVFKDEHAKRGSRSMAILPLQIADETVGLLALYSEEIGFFDDEELKLLTDLTGDIAFAINHMEKQEQLDYLAYYDELTGLANRTLFLERVAQYLRGAASGGHKLALFFVDLERFRNINDSLGRPSGDALLKQVAEWLSHAVGDANLLARLGADHFAIVLPVVKHEGSIAGLLDKRVRAFLDHSFQLNDTEFRIAAKIGAAIFPNDGTDADTLLRNAEAALKKAKARGERYLFYKPKMTEMVAGKLSLETQLRQALDKEEFVLHYQPKINLESGKLTGAEALIRWNDPRTGLVPPGRFIPVLEETGLILDVGRWALRQAIGEHLRWRAAGLPAPRIAVNVSPLQLRNRGFVAEIERALGIDALAAAGLELEITESLIMEDVKHNIASLQAIRATGVTIAIDDFGTGFSSLSYLAKLPVDTLKIDRSFVIDMTEDAQGLSLVSTIINLAHALKLKVVAEGVETEEQSRLLRLLRCDELQGFLFGKPVPTEIFEAKFLARVPVNAAA
jgi:diguanylate cyclase (GGDEF)-like protein/PAS domain S-box-containing protein